MEKMTAQYPWLPSKCSESSLIAISLPWRSRHHQLINKEIGIYPQKYARFDSYRRDVGWYGVRFVFNWASNRRTKNWYRCAPSRPPGGGKDATKRLLRGGCKKKTGANQSYIPASCVFLGLIVVLYVCLSRPQSFIVVSREGITFLREQLQ